jgi:DNA-binding transcriptional LysR family regulator
MDMNERQLHSFVITAELGSFSKAANAVNISPPALIQQINLLEESLSFKLFDRAHCGVTLTRAGETFLPAAQEILRLYRDTCQKCHTIAEAEQNSLRIACSSEMFPQMFLKVLQRFQEAGTRISFQYLPYSCHLREILCGNADISFIAEPGATFLQGLQFVPLYADTYSFCMRENHPLVEKAVIHSEDLDCFKIRCGRYDYLKTPFDKNLPASAILLPSPEYDIATVADSLLSDELTVIHSLWSQSYRAFLRVVPSDIPAGNVGILSRQDPPYAVQALIKELKAKIAEGPLNK